VTVTGNKPMLTIITTAIITFAIGWFAGSAYMFRRLLTDTELQKKLDITVK